VGIKEVKCWVVWTQGGKTWALLGETIWIEYIAIRFSVGFRCVVRGSKRITHEEKLNI